MINTFWLSVGNIPGVGSKTIKKLYTAFPEMDFLMLINTDFNTLLSTVKNRKVVEFLKDEDYMKSIILEAEKDISNYKKNNIEVISIADDRYPFLLKKIEDPPIVLFCRGNLDALAIENKIAIIGTRNATQKGLNAAAKIAVAFSRLNYVIVSGLAEGIDTAGHFGALEAKGITIAVLPGGIDHNSIYPAKNRKLAEEIVENNGLLLSEYPPGKRPQKGSFVQRDRIQSGLSLGVCPVQTDIKGGTQHTIDFSKKQQRILFCPIPTEEGNENLPAYRGIHELINKDRTIVLNEKEDYTKLDKLMKNSLSNMKKNIEVEDTVNDKVYMEQIDIFNYQSE